MTKVKEVIDFLHSIAPNHYQEDYDNAGLIVGNENDFVKGLLVSLDCTEVIIDEAISLGVNLIVSHHPIVFKGLKRFTSSSYVERVVMKAIRHDINLFAIHTNLDNVAINGVNSKICEILGLNHLQILKPKMSHLEVYIGSGMYGTLEIPMATIEFFEHLKTKMDLKTFKHTTVCHKKISTVAVCGGAGGFLLQDAIHAGAQIFITSDYKYHEYFDAEGQIIIADIGHYESERYTIDLLYTLISNNFTNFAAHYTKMDTNPVNYY